MGKKNKKDSKKHMFEIDENIENEKNEENKKLDNFNISISNTNIQNDNEENIIIKNFNLNAYGKILFENTDLTINKGNKYALIGPNGQGKSTLLLHIFHRKLPVPKNLNIFMVVQEETSTDKKVLNVVLESNLVITKLKKKLTELEELVILKGLSFGMDLSKYKLDKD